MTFDQAYDELIGNEDGYINDPNDPGGETNWGITKKSYPNLDIKSLTREQAKEIYLRDYWNKLPNLTYVLKFQLFDFAVASGVETAIRYMQKAVGTPRDGIWGPKSASAAAKFTTHQLILKLNAERLDFMTLLKNWPNDSKGWARRIAVNLRHGAIDT